MAGRDEGGGTARTDGSRDGCGRSDAPLPTRTEVCHIIREMEEQATHVGLRALKTPRPGILAEPGPQRSDRSSRQHFPGECLPTLGLPVLAGASGEQVDSSLQFLTAAALRQRKKEERRIRRSARRCTRRPSGLLGRQPNKLGSCLKGTRGRGRRRASGSFPGAPLLGLFLLALFALRNMDIVSTALILPGVWYFLGSTGGTVHASVFGCLFWTLFPRAPCAVQAPSGV